MGTATEKLAVSQQPSQEQAQEAQVPSQTMSDEQLAESIQGDCRTLYGAGATETLLRLGNALCLYAERGKSKGERSRRAYNVCAAAMPHSSDVEARVRLAIVACRLAPRVPRLDECCIRDLEAIVESARIGINWKTITTTAAPAVYARLTSVVAALLDGKLGNRERKGSVKPHPSEWRKAVRAVVIDGETVDDLIARAESEKQQPSQEPQALKEQPSQGAESTSATTPAPNSSATVEQAATAVALQQLEQPTGTVVNSAADMPSLPPVGADIDASLSQAVSLFRHCLTHPEFMLALTAVLTRQEMEDMASMLVDRAAERFAIEQAERVMTADAIANPKAPQAE